MHGPFGGIKKGDSAPAQLLGVFGIKTGDFDCQNGLLTFLPHPDQAVDVNLIGFRRQAASDNDDGVDPRISRCYAGGLEKNLKIKMRGQTDVNGVADTGTGKRDQIL